MVSLQTTTFRELLPPNFKYDNDAIAASLALQGEYENLVNSINKCIVFPAIMELEEDKLDVLAIDLHVDFYETDLTLVQKQTLVFNSLVWHIHKGTPETLENVLRTIAGGSRVEEWFEYDGDPYYFRVIVDLYNQGFTDEIYDKYINLIHTYKNTRSHLDSLTIYQTSEADVYISTVTITGETITVYPYSIDEIEISTGIPKIAINTTLGETITIFPEAA